MQGAALRRFSDLFPPEVAQRWRECFDLVRDTASPVRLFTIVSTQSQFWLECEVFIAPLGARPDDTTLGSVFWLFVS
jgi:hypothetical protein